jgi:uncharacterized protein YegL
MPIDFDHEVPRALPVLILADTSGSMSVDGKIGVLNESISRMITEFQGLELPGAEVNVGVIAFGADEARVHLPLSPVDGMVWQPLTAAGSTPMGGAFRLATELLDDPTQIPGRSYQPNLVLVSDGIPTDRWEAPLEALNSAERAGRALRFAIGIGADQKVDVLKRFAGSEGEVVPADRVELLTEFFRYVTFTVSRSATSASRSQADLPRFDDFTADPDDGEF